MTLPVDSITTKLPSLIRPDPARVVIKPLYRLTAVATVSIDKLLGAMS